MQSKRDGLIPVAEVLSDLGGPVQAIRDTSPQPLGLSALLWSVPF